MVHFYRTLGSLPALALIFVSFCLPAYLSAQLSITCPGNITQGNDPGECSAVVSFTPPEVNESGTNLTTVQTNGLPSGSAFPVGVTQMTFTVSNDEGDSDACTFFVIVQDTEDPVFDCPEDITVNAAENDCSTIVTFDLPTATDNCGDPDVSQFGGLPSGSAFPVGENSVDFQALDAEGNIAFCRVVINVIDVNAPSIDCPDDIVVEVTDDCDAVVNYAAPVGTDLCGDAITAQTGGLGSGSTFPLGATTEEYTVTDEAGNTASCSFTVTVTDIAPPVINCPGDISIAAPAGACTAVATFADPTTTDNCPGETLAQTAGPASGEAFPAGETTVTYTATDASGNTSECSFTVTVTENEDPEITCPLFIAVDNDPGECSAVVNYTAPEGTDNCPGAMTELTSGLGSGGTFPIGTSVETYTVTDASGNTAECSFEVTVNDTEAPVFDCPENITAETAAGLCEAVVTFSVPPATDNCSPVTITQTAGPASGNAFPTGSTGITFTAEDEDGNTSTCTFNVVVTDAEDPTIDCPGDVEITLPEGICEGEVTYSVPTANDNCPGVTIALTDGPAIGETVNAGLYTVTYQATDASGNTAECSFTVTLIETGEPEFNCPGNIEIDAASGTCEAVVTFAEPTATDPCSDVTVVQTAGPVSGSTFPAGDTTIEFTAEDEFGNTSVCTFTVTVVDDTPPEITCPENLIVDNDPGACGAAISYDLPTATDNCGDATVSLISGPASGDFFPAGTTEVTYEAEDLSGNTSQCSFNVTVNDVEAPVLTCPSDISIPLADGSCDAVVNFPPASAIDNCAVASVVQIDGIAPGEIFPAGTTTVTYEAVDDAGNSATCSFEVTLTESVAPEINCPADIDVDNDPGECGAVVTYTAPEGTDDCPGAVTSLTAGLASGEQFPVGTTTVTYTVTDLSQNETSCSFTVTVNDTEAPEFDCSEPITLNTNEGVCGTEALFDIPTATDNCDDPLTPVQVSGPAPGDFIAVGTAEAIFEVTDAAGNTAQCIVPIEVIDNEDPFITCPDDIVIDVASGDCDATVIYDTPTATDNCAIADVVLTSGLASSSEFPAGETTVTYTATDVNGNTAECSFTVTVSEDVPPTITCPDNIIVANDPGTCGAVVDYDLPEAIDACGDVTLELLDGPASGAEFPEGITSVTYEATDISGNTSQCTFTVTVNDEESPTFDCPDNVTLSNDAGECGAVYNFDLPEAIDNCTADVNVAQTSGPATGELLGFGATVFTFTATDEAGNTTECSYTVEVTDEVAPVFEDCPEDITVYSGVDDCAVEISYPTPVATDNCSAEVTFGSGPESGDALEPGSYNVVFNAADPSGNTAECSFAVNVIDTIAPVIVCPDTIQSCEFSVVFDAPEATDNCEIAEIVQTAGPESGTNFPIGFTTITFEAIDLSGNTAECSFVIERLVTAPRAEAGNDQNICSETSVFLNGNNPGDDAVGTWIFESGFGIIADENDPTTEVEDLQVGLNVFVWFIDPLNGCDFETDTVTIIVEEGVTVDAGEDELIQAGGQASLFATGLPPGGSFIWQPEAGLSCIECPNPTVSPNETTEYFATYTSPLGCSVTDSLVVRVFRELPNTITPDNDGVNDVWNIPGIAEFPNVEVAIFNRWGNEIFSSTGYREPWDGTRGGEELPAGSYYYIIDYKQDGKENLNGTVNIIR